MTLFPDNDGRLRASVLSGADRVVEFHLDGWPLLLIDLDESVVRVNDLRSTHAFPRVAELIYPVGRTVVDTEPIDEEQTILISVGTLVGSIRLDGQRPAHVEVRFIQMDPSMSRSEGVVVDCEVRYRQLSAQPTTMSRSVDALCR